MLQKLRLWIQSLFGRKPDPDAARLLYRFWDGRQWRRVDPWRTYRAILADPKFNLETHLPLVEKGVEPETTHCMQAICSAFGVQRYDVAAGTGMTDWELLSLLDSFTGYLDALEKKTDDGRISSSPTGGTSSGSPAVPSLTTSSSSASGDASIAPNTAAPVAS